jgi:hypothetical protein
MAKLKESKDGFSYIQSVTILQELYRDTYATVHGVRLVPIGWQATVPPQYLSSQGLAAASSWLVQRIGELTYPMTFAD